MYNVYRYYVIYNTTSLLIDSKLLMPMNNKLCCRKLFDNSEQYILCLYIRQTLTKQEEIAMYRDIFVVFMFLKVVVE